MRRSLLRLAPALGLWVTLLALDTPRAYGQDTEAECPIYRVYDAENPGSTQFMSEDGCRCVDGMFDLHCHYCTSDDACKTVNPDHVCMSGILYNEFDTYKSYKCKLTNTLESLFTGGKASFFSNLTDGTVLLSIYNTESINQQHAVDCFMTNCTMGMEGGGGKCGNAVCKCTDYCSDFTRSVVEDMLGGSEAELIISGSEDGYSTLVSLKVVGAPFSMEALCNASSCTLDQGAAEEEIPMIEYQQDMDWGGAATFSLVVICAMAGILVLLVFCVFIPYLWSLKGSKKGSSTYGRQTTTGDEDPYAGKRLLLEFRHINRTVMLRSDAAKAHGKKEKKILNNISGSVESGTLMAIMGPSGSGKSSLLNILAAVGSDKSRISGQILLNGKQQVTGYRNKVAYVQQDDSLYGTLTVQECIEYSAMLRLARDMKINEKQAVIAKTLEELGLTDIATNRIGSGGRNAGVSGGERKRVSIGMELVSQASVLVLDEPTSGLDSFAANQIINLLSELARRNRIVILSVHQPSMKSFMMFDQILLLGGGRVMYNGKPSEAESFFADKGFLLPTLETVADHMLDVVSDKVNCDMLKGPDTQRGDYERLTGDDSGIDPAASAEDGEALESNDYQSGELNEPRSLLNEVMILFSRTAKDIFRNRDLFIMQMSISVLLAVFAGAIFSDVSNNLAGFQNRMGAFYFSLSFFAFASFSSMDIFVRERVIFVRETGSKYFRAFSYFLAKTVLDMFVLRVIPVSIFCFIFYWMMGLRNSPDAFVIFWATLVLFNVCAGTMSICISIATPTVGQANLIAAVWFLIMLLFGGFLVNVDSMEPWYAWLKYTSIFYYSFEILMTNELSGLMLSFDAPGYPAIPIYGEVFLLTIGMDATHQMRDLICLLSLAFGFSVAAYLLLLLRVPSSAGRQFARMNDENRRLCRSLKPTGALEEQTINPRSVQ